MSAPVSATLLSDGSLLSGGKIHPFVCNADAGETLIPSKIRGRVFGPPGATARRTSEELAAEGFVGLYAIPTA